MSVFLHRFQNECRALAIEAKAHMVSEQSKFKDYVNRQDEILEEVVQRKALTYIIVTMNLFAFKYLPALEKGEAVEPVEETVRAIPRAMQEISTAKEKVYKDAYSICMRGMRLSREMCRRDK